VNGSSAGTCLTARTARALRSELGYTRLSQKNRFNTQGYLGTFSGLSSRTVIAQIATLNSPLPPVIVTSNSGSPVHVDGAGMGLSLSDVYTPLQKLTLSGQYERFSPNFLTAREDSRYSGQSSYSVSGNYRLNKYVDFNAGTNNRKYLVGENDTSRGYTYGAKLFGSHQTANSVRLFPFHSTKSKIRTLAGVDLSQYSFSLPYWKRFSAFTYFYTTAAGPTAAKTFSTFVSTNAGHLGQFAFHHQTQFGNNNSVGGSWQLEQPRFRSSILVGIDRNSHNNNKTDYLPYTGLRMGLPRHLAMEMRYSAEAGNSILQFSIGGPLIARRELVRSSGFTTPAVVIPSHLTGTVYQDMNANGVFDPGVDVPISGLRVTLDDGTTATTDAHGTFHFSQVTAGSHVVRAEVSQIPADMVLTEGDERTLAIVPRRNNTTSFRLVKTGLIKGKVTFGESIMGGPEGAGVPEIRVIAKGEHDGISELNGSF